MGRENDVAQELNICCSAAEHNSEAEKISVWGQLSPCASGGPPNSEAWGRGSSVRCLLLYSWVISHSVRALNTCCIHSAPLASKSVCYSWEKGKCFELVLDILQEICKKLLVHILAGNILIWFRPSVSPWILKLNTTNAKIYQEVLEKEGEVITENHYYRQPVVWLHFTLLSCGQLQNPKTRRTVVWRCCSVLKTLLPFV